ncbi:MAG: glutamate 5-kinase [Anaerotignum sp.]|nr:glutamate 5-kinase [Anaerotignum sp.]
MRELLTDCKRVVVKVGTSTITYPNGLLNLKRIEELAWVLTDLRNSGKDVVLVTSGAIGVGAVRMGMKERPTVVRQKQAAAAVGQAMIMQIYHNFFDRYNQTVAQVLLTKEEVGSEERYLNTKNTMETLMELGVIPIVNANDTISTYEIEISDNDRLSAMVAEIIQADLLILMTDIDALYDQDPKTNANAKRISCVDWVTEEVKKMAGGKGSKFSVGGMLTKLQAAEICQEAGVRMAIVLGDTPTIIHRVIAGEDVGTFFHSKKA